MNTESKPLNAAFEKWWQEEGQYCRAGGSYYEKTFAYRAYQAALESAPTSHPIPTGATGDRDWELACDNCNGSGHVFVKHQVAERKTDVQEFKEECEACEGRGFNIAFEDIPGIAEYVKSCRSAPSATGDALGDPALQKLFGDAITGALGFGAQGVNPPPVGHWLEPFWNMARADATVAAGNALNAARYLWLRDESWAGYNQAKRKPQVAETIVFVADGAGNVRTILAEEALDAAIDAAIAQQKGEA